MESFLRLIMNILIAWCTIYFIEWICNGDFQREVIYLFALVIVDLMMLRQS
jgi:hypothetical protein